MSSRLQLAQALLMPYEFGDKLAVTALTPLASAAHALPSSEPCSQACARAPKSLGKDPFFFASQVLPSSPHARGGAVLVLVRR